MSSQTLVEAPGAFVLAAKEEPQPVSAGAEDSTSSQTRTMATSCMGPLRVAREAGAAAVRVGPRTLGTRIRVSEQHGADLVYLWIGPGRVAYVYNKGRRRNFWLTLEAIAMV